MTLAELKVVSSVETTTEETKFWKSELVSIALFSGMGLLVSLAVIILDQITPGEWF